MSVRINFIIGAFLISCSQQQDQNEEKKYVSQHQIPTYEENWDFYLGLIDSTIASTFVDLSLSDIAPVDGFDKLANVKVILKEPNPEMLSSDTEFSKLTEIEDYLIEILGKGGLCIYVGRYTTDGYRDHCFYTQDSSEFFQRIPSLKQKFPDYEFTYGINYDPKWETYRDFLYPSPIQMQSIQNRQILHVLEENGDSLTKRRIVDHWIYFKDDSSRSSFLTEVKKKGFNVVEIWNDSEYSTEYTFALQVNRMDYVSYSEIDNVTHPLFELAEEYNGIYDGWETFVEE